MEIRTQDGQVMLEGEFRSYIKSNNGPTWDQTTPEILAELGADVVLEGPQAAPGRYQVAYRDGVQEIDGKWYTKYSVADMEQDAKSALDAQQASSVREQRNRLLAETDWMVIKALESNTPQNFEMAAYRQALRDITSQPSFPWDIQWPNQPK